MGFDDALNDMADAALDAFDGESATWTPAGGVGRPITVIVNRFPRMKTPFTERLYKHNIEVQTRNHGTTGIDPSETGFIGGTLTLPIKAGGAAVAIPVAPGNPVAHDSAWVVLAL